MSGIAEQLKLHEEILDAAARDGLRLATDNELRNECARRGIDGPRKWCTADELCDIGMQFVKSCGDDVLRAECERRGVVVSAFDIADAADILAERDEWKRQFERAVKERDEVAAAHRRTADEWKRRAEAAEAGRDDLMRLVNMQDKRLRGERGPGIAATKPADEHYVDRWDFIPDAD